jgi:zinc transporter ZupT
MNAIIGQQQQQPVDIKVAKQTLKHCASCLDMLTHEFVFKTFLINYLFSRNRAVITTYLNDDGNTEKKVDLLKSLTFAFAISFHSVLEGFALGVQVKNHEYIVDWDWIWLELTFSPC